MHALEHTESALWLEVRPSNRAAIDFYRSMGMKVVGTIPDYYCTEDALVMIMAQNRLKGREEGGLHREN